MKKLLTILAAVTLIAALLAGCQVTSAAAEENYVALDMGEAGVQFIVGGNDKVIALSASTAEGEEVLYDEDYLGEDIEEVIEDVVENAAELGYADTEATEEDPNGVLVTTSCTNEGEEDQLRERIRECVNNAYQNNGIWAIILTADEIAEIDTIAEQYGISVGHVRMIMAIMNADPEFTYEEGAAMTGKELMNLVKTLKPVGAAIQTMNQEKTALQAERGTLDETADAARISEIDAQIVEIDAALTKLQTAHTNMYNGYQQKKQANSENANQWKAEKQQRSETVKAARNGNGNGNSEAVRAQKITEVGERVCG